MARPPRKRPPTSVPEGFDTIDPTSLPCHGSGRVEHDMASTTITVVTSKNNNKKVCLTNNRSIKTEEEPAVTNQQLTSEAHIVRPTPVMSGMVRIAPTPHAINFPTSSPPVDTELFQTPTNVQSNPASNKRSMSLPQSEDGVRFVVQNGVKKMLFRKVKFYDKRVHGEYSESTNTVCGLMLQWCNIASTGMNPNVWWRDIQPLVQQTHTNHRNNCIKAMRVKYRGK